MKRTNKLRLGLFLLSVNILFTGFNLCASTALITGFNSDNLVSLDLTTGESHEIYQFGSDARPRAVAHGSDGAIFVALRGTTGNIVKLIPSEIDGFTLQSLTRAVGQNGPGKLVLDARGLWVAAGSERGVLLFDENTGEELSWIPGRPFNPLGLLVTEDYVYTAEYFQRSIARYAVNQAVPETTVLVSDSDELDRPMAMARGHTGNIFVVNETRPTMVEFDLQTGEFIRTFADLSGEDVTGLRDLVFDPITMQYYAVEGSRVHVLDREGRHVRLYTIPDLDRAEAIALFPSDRQPVRRLTIDRSFLRVEGVAGERYAIEASTDLVNWEQISLVENLHGDLTFVDPDFDEFDRRFYRMQIIE